MIRTSQMERTSNDTGTEQVPGELVALKERIRGQSPNVRAELEPLIDEVMEHAVFRSRVLLIARDALQRFRTEMAAMQLDIEARRREAGSC